MQEEVKFEQFRVTPVNLKVAAALVEGNSSALKVLSSDERFSTNEYLLATGAKLVWIKEHNTFGIFSYAHDGSDGRRAYYDMAGGPEEFYRTFSSEYRRVVAERVVSVVTDELRAELEEEVRAQLRDLSKTYRIGYLDDLDYTFDEYDIETVELSTDFDVCGDAMDKVWVEYSIQMDLLSR